MKSRIVSLTIATLLSCGWAHAQAGDAGIITAVMAENYALNTQLTANLAEHTAILAAQGAINLQMNKILEYEEKTYKYLSTVNGAIKDAYDIARCGTLVTKIIDNLGDCTKAAKNHPQGAIIAGLVSRQYIDIIAESSALASYVASLVTKGGEKNLLNSAERNQVLSNVKSRLGSINSKLVRLRYQIELTRWSDVIRLDMSDWENMAQSSLALREAKMHIKQYGKFF